MIDGPGYYLDRIGRTAWVKERASHNPARWTGTAGDGDECCWEADGVMECSLPSAIDIVAKRPALATVR